ncbi:peptidoglycan bridge formation glycyltransferase FemA/FemB family protein [Candidatus Roizmanbacteria bacterium]|nr:peptidoglycan bridge formation glycyltransferase FemA/FemB family protein [Candidatus Roizmanbacteria bacterium]
MDIRQSNQYANFMKSLGWKVEHVGKWQAFVKPFPLLGSFIKIQRIGNPIPWEEIRQLAKKHRAYRVIIEPSEEFKNPQNTKYQIQDTIHSPSKTIHIDLTSSEETIFHRFNPTTRRAVRKAQKNNVTIEQSNNIEAFIRLKTKHMFPLGFLMGREIRKLWNAFRPQDARLLLAYQTVVPISPPIRRISNRPEIKPHAMRHYNNTYYCSDLLGGILLLFHHHTAYYWHAAATNEGKRLFTPTLLVWEALKLAKKRGCKVFDFEGVYDERFQKDTKNWRGFTRFKSGFGGREIELPPPLDLH